MGGYAGLCDGLGGATEHRGDGTPHVHGFINLANAYQHRTLEDIALMIEKDMLKLDDIVAFVDRFAKEDHYDNDAHQNNLDELEKDFVANHTSPTNVFMMAKPECLYQSDPTISLWSDGKSEAASKTAATLYNQEYKKDVQYVFSRVQHHWHALQDGKRVPLRYCRCKIGKNSCGCKQGYP